MPEDETGRIPIDTFDLHDDPDAWEDICDDLVIWPEDEGEE